MRLYMPTKVFFGSGCVSENGAELKALGSRAMIVTGKHSSRINGSLAAVEQALQANGQTYVIFDEIEENPSVETVAVAAGIAVKEQVDFFVAVGGGSPMDASKAISASGSESIGNRSCRGASLSSGADAGLSGCSSPDHIRYGIGSDALCDSDTARLTYQAVNRTQMVCGSGICGCRIFKDFFL